MVKGLQRLAQVMFPLLGVALLLVVLARSDLDAVWAGITLVGWLGIAIVLAIHALSFLGDSALWLLAYPELPFSARWCRRFYEVRLIGEAYNNATPFASMGGEPLKAKLMKDRYDIPYTASAIAFLVAKTANLAALCAFLLVGFAAMLLDPRFTTPYKGFAAAGLAAFAVATIVVIVLQRSGIGARLQQRLARRHSSGRLQKLLARIVDFESQLGEFYAVHHARFHLTVVLALGTWIAGLFEVWVVLATIGHPISLVDAWIVEAVAQLIRVAVFFIPSGLGVVDASFVLVVGLLTGNSSYGVVVAIARRFRDLVWLGAGMALPLIRARFKEQSVP